MKLSYDEQDALRFVIAEMDARSAMYGVGSLAKVDILRAALAQQAQPLDALHRLRAETETSFGHMYIDEIHADLTGDEVCPGGCPQFAQQAQPECEYVLYDEFKSRMYALLDLPIESHDNDGVGESIDYVRRDAVAAIAKRPFSPIRAKQAQRCEHGATSAHPVGITGFSKPCPGPQQAQPDELMEPCEERCKGCRSCRQAQPWKCDYCGSRGPGHKAGCMAPDESGKRPQQAQPLTDEMIDERANLVYPAEANVAHRNAYNVGARWARSRMAQQAQPEQKEAGPPLLPTECQPCTVSIPQPEMPTREMAEALHEAIARLQSRVDGGPDNKAHRKTAKHVETLRNMLALFAPKETT